MKYKKTWMIIFLGLICFQISINFHTISSCFPPTSENEYSYDPESTENNPLRGFMPYMGEYSTFPYSLEFFYLPLNNLMDDFNSYTFDTSLEPRLEEIAARNNQAVFRIYLDYPGEPTGLPDFLLNGLTTYSYEEFGGGISPDYSNETLISTLETFIDELGSNYDGDKRIGFIQIGLLGHWGEWHTYPHEEWFPEETIQNRILYSFEKAFNKTRILVRYPSADSPELEIGYHDDSFAYETIGQEEWQFYNQLIEAGVEEKWKEEPIGGEVRPEIQEDLWNLMPPSSAQDFTTCVELTHTSWLLNHELFEGDFNSKQLQRAKESALLLGYQFFIPLITTKTINQQMNINITIQNLGSAPFYYLLNLQIGIDGSFSKIENFITEIENISIMPGEEVLYHLSLPAESITNESKITCRLVSSNTFTNIAVANLEMNENRELDIYPYKTITQKSGINYLTVIFLVYGTNTLIVISSLKVKKRERKNKS
jgi:hypothetical protein